MKGHWNGLLRTENIEISRSPTVGSPCLRICGRLYLPVQKYLISQYKSTSFNVTIFAKRAGGLVAMGGGCGGKRERERAQSGHHAALMPHAFLITTIIIHLLSVPRVLWTDTHKSCR